LASSFFTLPSSTSLTAAAMLRVSLSLIFILNSPIV
jgi:hypothetical protein